MPNPTLASKKAYCAKTRRSNYAASLRLSGFPCTPLDAERPLPSREQLLNTYRNTPT
ncbi:YhfG family protein [Pseudomonas sp. Pseusp122]|uniref:YhfG family protein n=1 Tax=unclassified Pseudomonas TaxID=196821 RepID=UPI0039A4DA86